ncbi:hypothetical protein ACWEOW_20240 [Monashia sp. NPDC004114]
MSVQTHPVIWQTADFASQPLVEESPWDHTMRPRPLSRKATHRFPAATYLHRTAAREERAYAKGALDATGRSTGRRVGGLFVVVIGAFAGLLILVATGRTTTPIQVMTMWALGAAMTVAVVRLVVLLRRHEHESERLADRVRAYESRLLELRAQRRLA